MPVELGPVDAGELRLATHRDAASAAHAGSIDHDGIQAHNGVDRRRAGHLGAGLHHEHRADGDACGHIARRDHLGQHLAHEALVTLGPVVGGNEDLVGDRLELLAQDDQVGAPGSDDRDHFDALAVQGLGDGVQGRRPEAAPHADAEAFDLLEAGRQAQRTGDVGDELALLQGAEPLAGGPHPLDDESDGPRIWVGVADGQWNALGSLGRAYDHELPGLAPLSDSWRLDVEPHDALGEQGLALDLMHELRHLGQRCQPLVPRSAGLRQGTQMPNGNRSWALLLMQMADKETIV